MFCLRDFCLVMYRCNYVDTSSQPHLDFEKKEEEINGESPNFNAIMQIPPTLFGFGEKGEKNKIEKDPIFYGFDAFLFGFTLMCNFLIINRLLLTKIFKTSNQNCKGGFWGPGPVSRRIWPKRPSTMNLQRVGRRTRSRQSARNGQ